MKYIIAIQIMLFMVATTHPENDEVIARSIGAQFPDDHYVIGRGRWLVSFNGTTQELYNKLFPDNAASLPIIGGLILFSLNAYYGRSPLNMWEWMANKIK